MVTVRSCRVKAKRPAFSFAVGEALLLFALLATQLLIPDPQFRTYCALGYVFLAIGWITFKPGYREAVVALLARDANPSRRSSTGAG